MWGIDTSCRSIIYGVLIGDWVGGRGCVREVMPGGCAGVHAGVHAGRCAGVRREGVWG